LVVGCPEAECGDAVRVFAVRKLQNAKEDRAVSPEGKLFAADVDARLVEHPVEHVHKFRVRDGFERAGRLRCGYREKLGTRDEIGIDVRAEGSVFHFDFSFSFWNYTTAAALSSNSKKKRRNRNGTRN